MHADLPPRLLVVFIRQITTFKKLPTTRPKIKKRVVRINTIN